MDQSRIRRIMVDQRRETIENAGQDAIRITGVRRESERLDDDAGRGDRIGSDFRCRSTDTVHGRLIEGHALW